MFPYFQLESLVHWVSITSIFPCLSNLNPTFTLHFYLKTDRLHQSKEQHPSTSIFLTHTNPATISLTLCTDSLTKLPGALRQLRQKVPCWISVLQVPVEETSTVNQKNERHQYFFSPRHLNGSCLWRSRSHGHEGIINHLENQGIWWALWLW